MAYRIVSRPETTTKTPPMKSKGYLAWLHELPCVVTGTSPVQAAHVSFAAPEWAAEGRGKSQKAHDSFALPLCASEHDRQHSMNEREYWKSVGINPHHICRVLFGIWNENKDTATERATRFLSLTQRRSLFAAE